MCGITGIFDTQGLRPVDEGLLSRMNQLQFHRGPDEGGMHIEPGIGLAHRRLSIIDLTHGQQPLFNEDGSVVVVFNGEIYNFAGLTKELLAAGHQFKTHCDTEVIVHAWEEWGEDCVKRFRGMFAFAIWDRNHRTLFLARDRMGIKPLHYALLPDGRLLFASEIKSLLACDALSREIEPRAVEDYFSYGYVPDPRSIFRSVHKLEPGYTLTVRTGQQELLPRQYWDVPFVSNGVLDEAEAQESLIERLREAVNIRLISEVPLGAFLSGGVDSSAIVALMAGLSDKPVSTCSISFGDPAFNEAQYAAQVAEQFGTDHQVEEVDPDDYALIDKLAGLYDEPYADSSAMPTYRVCELAKKRVTVALSGDGGDENFAGYRRYRWQMYEERLRNVLPRGLRKPLFGALGSVYPKIDWAPRVFRAKSTFQSLARDSVEGYFHNFSILPDALRRQLFSASFRQQLDGYHGIEVFNRYLDSAPEHPLSMVQYLDMKTYLSGDILTKVDRASMAHALEVRVPLLDHEFVEWVSGLPPEMKLAGSNGKRIFKRAFEPHLSKEILYRNKMGFAVPLANWFRGDLRQRLRDSLLGDTLAATGIFDRKFMGMLVDQHLSGRRDHSACLWALLMFESFHRQLVQ
jgi:asparagine synthase (glutamine-hydrolysing)